AGANPVASQPNASSMSSSTTRSAGWRRDSRPRADCSAHARQCTAEPVAGMWVVEVHQGPRVRRARAHERFVPMVAVAEDEPSIVILREQRRWLPSLLEALFHCVDLAFPLLGLDRTQRLV